MASHGAGTGGDEMSAEDQMRDEIARLTATINQHKSSQSQTSSGSHYYAPYPQHYHHHYGGYHHGGYRGRGGRGRGTVMGSGGGPHKQYVRPGLGKAAGVPSVESEKGKENADVGEENGEKMRKEVIIGGVAFEASKRSLVRKELAKPKTAARKGRQGQDLPRSARAYQPKGRNMRLDNTGRSYSHHAQSKKTAIRKIEKPCSRFTKTGTCSRGLTCAFQHDPRKIALCWSFMQGECPKTVESCNLSHEPTPERTPLCVHFLNRGRCTKEKCLFPHVNVGKKEGVCKNFAVLGYCEKGLECERNHVRECPEFEEKGECRTRGCKLPHVIKASARWAKKEQVEGTEEQKEEGERGSEERVTAESGKLGDEYISLIFNESESGSESESEEETEEGTEDEMEVHT